MASGGKGKRVPESSNNNSIPKKNKITDPDDARRHKLLHPYKKKHPIQSKNARKGRERFFSHLNKQFLKTS